MPTKVPRYYWDSNVFLSYIEATPGRVSDIEAMLEAAEEGRVEIYTSVITIAEVAFAKDEKDARVLDKAQEEAIEALWEHPSPVKLVEFYRPIADEARQLVRVSMKDSLGLKPMDAIHMASANRLNVDALHTYDGPMQKNESLVIFPVVPPPARWQGTLFDLAAPVSGSVSAAVSVGEGADLPSSDSTPTTVAIDRDMGSETDQTELTAMNGDSAPSAEAGAGPAADEFQAPPSEDGSPEPPATQP